jgi:hypothetical protein
MPAPKKARRRVIDDEEEDFDDETEEEAAARIVKGKPKSEAKPTANANARAGDEFYSIGAYGKKTPKLAVLASLACSNSALVGKRIE